MNLVADFGTIRLYENAPPLSPVLRFIEAVSLGANNFRTWLANRSNRRGGRISGVTEIWKHVAVWQPTAYELEAFAPTRDELELIIADYLCRFPREQFETRFCRIRDEEFDGWSVRGERLCQRRETI